MGAEFLIMAMESLREPHVRGPQNGRPFGSLRERQGALGRS